MITSVGVSASVVVTAVAAVESRGGAVSGIVGGGTSGAGGDVGRGGEASGGAVVRGRCGGARIMVGIWGETRVVRVGLVEGLIGVGVRNAMWRWSVSRLHD